MASPPKQASPTKVGPPPAPGMPASNVSSTPSTYCPPEMKKPAKTRKPYEEIGAVFNGNEIKIRVPKSTFKPPKLTPSQQKLMQECTCGDDRPVCGEDCGFPEPDMGYGPTNKYNFQIPDDLCEGLTNRTGLNSEMVYNYCKNEEHAALCNVCNVTPGNAPKGVSAQKVLHPNKDVFLLKIGKQTDEPNRTGNIEVELVTPRAPAKPQPPLRSCKQIQCEQDEFPCCGGCGAYRSCAARSRRSKLRRPMCCS